MTLTWTWISSRVSGLHKALLHLAGTTPARVPADSCMAQTHLQQDSIYTIR